MDRQITPATFGVVEGGHSQRISNDIWTSFIDDQHRIHIAVAKTIDGQQKRLANLEQYCKQLEKVIEKQDQINQNTLLTLKHLRAEHFCDECQMILECLEYLVSNKLRICN